ncbi:MAG: sulfotransferase family protein [Candidatus Nanoarchaeia archaeon]
MNKPNLFIVGAAKSGTTAMHEFLKEHPEVFMCEPKEPGYFAKDFKTQPMSRKEYFKYFKRAKNERIVGESSTGYLRSKVAPKLIKEFNPQAKIIIMLREPVNFLYSFHSQKVFNLHEPVKDFEKALSLEKQRRKGKYLPKGTKSPSKLFYSEWAKFSEQVKNYYKYFNKEQVKIILYDDFKADPIKVYNEVLKFLGVSPFKPTVKYVNANKYVKTPGVKRFLDKIGLSRKLIKIIPESVYLKLVKPVRKLMFEEKPRPKLSNTLRKRLMKEYKPEVKRLSKLLNRDLVSLWGYNL